MNLAYFVWKAERDPSTLAAMLARQGLELLETVVLPRNRAYPLYICRERRASRRAVYFVMYQEEGQMHNAFYPNDFWDLDAARKWARA